MYCSNCGEKLPENSKFCTKCGASINLETKPETVIQSFERDPKLQEHWIRRLIAYVVDSIIVFVATALLLALLLFPIFIANPASIFNLLSFPFAMGLIYIFYFTVADSFRGATIGKEFFGLRVKSNGENPNLERAFIRNISKIHWVLLLLDLVAGLVTSTDLHQKYSDRIADTTVT